MKHSTKNLSEVLLVLAYVVCLALSLVACNGGKNSPSVLSAPVIDIDDSGMISWAKVENAVGYIVQENGEDVATVYELSYPIAQTLPGTYNYTVKALGDGEKYLDSAPSEAKSYTVAAIKLAQPVLNLEGNVLSWNEVENASSYDLYEKQSIILVATSQTQYIIPEKAVGSYFYTVIANGDGESYLDSEPSEAVEYKVEPAKAQQLAKPVLSLSENVLSWSAIDNALAYEVYEDDKKVFSGAALSYTIEKTEPGNYSYTVIAKGDGKLYSDSEPSDPKVYSIVPQVAQKLDKPMPRFSGNVLSWEAVDNAIEYEVYEGKNQVHSGKELSYTVDKTEAGTYVYTVIAKGDGENYLDSDPSDECTFTIEERQIKLPSPVLRLEGKKLCWERIENADSYDVYLDGKFVANVVIKTEYDIPKDEIGSYSYTVAAKSDGEKYIDSDPSEPIVFAISKLLTPSGFEICEQNGGTYLKWTAVENASGYSVSVNSQAAVNVKSPEYKLDHMESYAYGTYKFSVVALAGDDPCFKDSDAGEYEYVYADENALSAPNVTLGEDKFTLMWQAVAGATAYRIYFTSFGSVNCEHVLETTIEASAAADGNFSYAPAPQDLQDGESRLQYSVAAVKGEKEGAASMPVTLYRFDQPRFTDISTTISGGVLSWERACDPQDHTLFATEYAIYCNGALETVVYGTSYPIPQKRESGYYFYTVVAQGKHLPSVPTPEHIYNEILKPLDLENKVSFALSSYGSLTIDLDESVELRKWYDVEVKIVRSSLPEVGELVAPSICIFGAEEPTEDPEWDAVAKRNVGAKENVYSVTLIPVEQLIKIISDTYMENVSYVAFEISIAESATKDPIPDDLPGEQGDEHKIETSVTGEIGVGSCATIMHLYGLDNVAVTLDAELTPGVYQMTISPVDGMLTFGNDVRIGYTFEESEANDGICAEITNDNGVITADIEVKQGATHIYFLNLDTNASTYVNFSATLIDNGGGQGGGSEQQGGSKLSLDTPVTLEIISSQAQVDVAENVAAGEYTLRLSSGYDDALSVQMFGEDITVIIGENTYTLYAQIDGSYWGIIELPEGATNITIDIALNEVYDILIELFA